MEELAVAFGLAGLAELGDRSQLVCLALSARHPPLMVALGATLAFALLNALAVVVGATLGDFIPTDLVRGLAALLFAAFGVKALLSASDDDDDDESPVDPGRALLSAMGLLVMAEMGDRTQLAVAALASVQAPLPTWAGATLGMSLNAAVACWVGAWLMPRLPRRRLAQLTGATFLVIAALLALSLLL